MVQTNRLCVSETILPRGNGPNDDAPIFMGKATRIEGRLAPMPRDEQS